MTSNPSRVSSLIEVTIFHADHGIGDAHQQLLTDWIAENTIAPTAEEVAVANAGIVAGVPGAQPAANFFLVSALPLPENCADLLNGIHGPLEGDDPVPSSEVWWAQRGRRGGASRMCDRKERPCREMTFLGVRLADREDGTAVANVFTAYGGKCAPREVTDPNCPAVNLEEALQFWAQHALSGVRPA